MIMGLENQHFYNIEKVGRPNVSVLSVRCALARLL